MFARNVLLDISYVAFVYVLPFFTPVLVVSESDIQVGDRQIRRAILSHYNKTLPPNQDESPTNIQVAIVTKRIKDYDDKTSLLFYEAFLFLGWTDSRLSWMDDPVFNKTSRISLRSDELWKPSLNIFNGGRAVQYGKSDLPSGCNSSGFVWFAIAVELHPTCEPADYMWFPSETHTCAVSLGALYPQSIAAVALELTELSPKFRIYRRLEVQNPHWELLAVTYSKEYVSKSEDLFFSMDHFTFKISRQKPLLWLSFLPTVLSCTILSWSSLILPATSGCFLRRLSLTTFSLLLQSLLMSALVKTVYSVGQRSPIIVKVHGLCVVLAFFALLHTLLIPRIIRKFSRTFHRVCQSLPPTLQVIFGTNKLLVDESLIRHDQQDDQTVRSDVEQFQKEPKDHLSNNHHLMTQACNMVHLMLQFVIFLFGLILLIVI